MSRRHARAASRPYSAVPRAAGGKPSTPTIEHAWALYTRGEGQKAESLCRSTLALRADDCAALSLLGIILAQSRRGAEAASLLERVAAQSTQDAAAHNNYGNVLRDLGRLSKALSCYDRAIAILPAYPEAHYNRGVTLHDLRRSEEALASYDRALDLKPDYASAWNNRGATLRSLGRPEEALESYARAIAIQPGYAEAHNNRGVTLHELGRFEEAVASYERALAIKPDHADAHNNRGASLQKLGRLEEALASHEHAIAIKPDDAEAHNGYGVILTELERFEEALESYERALAIDPEYAEAYSNRGMALRALKRHAEALSSYERALGINPSYVNALRNKGAVLVELKRFEEALACYERGLALREDVEFHAAQAATLHELKRTEEAVECYERVRSLAPDAGFLLGTCRHARMHLCDWTGFDGDIAQLADGIERGRPVVKPFAVLSLLDSPALQRKATDLWLRTECSPRVKLPPLERYPRHDRIRIGYFSADLRNHAVALLTAELFETHDRSRFELTAFSLGPDVRDALRTRIEPAFDRFLSVGGLSDHAVAALARRLEIDIAVDLGGYTGDARPHILALRAAPVQASYLGYLGSMGGDFMDYLFADPVIVPPESRAHYAEKIAYLPSYQANDSKRVVAERTFTRAELGLPPSGVVFCCFNASWKITPETFASWMRILSAVPGSVLLLLAGSAAVERNLRRQAAAHGASPERLVFGGMLTFENYLARYRSADLFLDTSPYNAGTTGSDALWAGLPVLTCIGNAFAARVGASLLTAVGLPELIAPDRAAYERLAIELATQPERLAEIRRRLAANRAGCTLFDTHKFTKSLEALYERMYLRHQAGLVPDHLEPS
jgi:protein O-GlcNAc transferase